jgi:hypothetical protein
MHRHLPFQFVLMVMLTFIAHAQEVSSRPPFDQRTVSSLPSIKGLPDLMSFADGSKVKTKADWKRRRQELIDQIEYYAFGRMPKRPSQLDVIDHVTSPIANGTEERMTLLIGSFKLRIAVYRPKGNAGKRPVIVREEHALGPWEDVPPVLDRGYLFVEFARQDLAPDKPDSIGSAQKAYPKHDWGTLAVWAWAAMRVMDYLETRDDADLGCV